MTIKRSDNGSVVAFYGLADVGAAALFYDNVLQWFQENNCAPNKLSVAGGGFPGKQTAFNRTHKRLMRSNFEEIDSVTITSLLPDCDAPISDWKMTAIFSLKNRYLVLGAGSSIVPLKSMLSVARSAIEHLKPCYGIGYNREMRLGPSLYALGVNYGTSRTFSGPEYEEGVHITRWGDAMEQHIYRDGLVRDIYPYNFLTEPQLSRCVTGIPLQEWIRQDSSRGQLVQFKDDVSLWSVDEKSTTRVREALLREGIIFDGQGSLNQ